MDNGERLKELREGAKIPPRLLKERKKMGKRAVYTLTHEMLAELSGVSKNTIAYIENGRIKNPGLNTIKKLMEALNLTLEDYLNV